MRISVKWTDDEQRRIEAAAVLSGQTAGAFMEKALSGSVKVRDAIIKAADKVLKKAAK